MVYRVDIITPEKLDLLVKNLSDRFSEYADIRDSVGNGYDADGLLLERGIASESELLQLYAETLGIEPFDEDEFSMPEKFPGIKPDYLLNFDLLPYKFDDERMALLAASPHLLPRHAEEFKKFFGLDLHFQLARRSLIERLINGIYFSTDESQNVVDDSEQHLR